MFVVSARSATKKGGRGEKEKSEKVPSFDERCDRIPHGLRVRRGSCRHLGPLVHWAERSAREKIWKLRQKIPKSPRKRQDETREVRFCRRMKPGGKRD